MKALTIFWFMLISLYISVPEIEGVDFIPVGCYRDKHKDARPLPRLLDNYRSNGLNWFDLYGSVVEPCAKKAIDKGFEYFGVQFYGECWSGSLGNLTYDIDGESDNCEDDVVGKDFALMVYKKITTETECSTYKTLSEPDRAYTAQGGQSCDHSLESNTWYRFTGHAGTAMAHSCTYKQHCGAFLTGWLQDTPPSVKDGIVNRKVCFSSRTKSNTGDCCTRHNTIKMRNCGKFYVYGRLNNAIAGCPIRFCGNQG